MIMLRCNICCIITFSFQVYYKLHFKKLYALFDVIKRGIQRLVQWLYLYDFFFSIRDIKSDQDSADDEKFSLDDMAKVKTG